MSAPADGGQTPETEEARRRRIADVFGDVLPDTTSDEREPEVAPQTDESARDAWYRDQVPPHHG